MKRILHAGFAIFFAAVLILPVCLTRWGESEYAAAERRNLASFPNRFQNGTLNPDYVENVIAWFEDHMGFRDSFVALRNRMQMDLFHLSPTDKVHLGKEGWLFYTQNLNLEIATGEYPLSEETMEELTRRYLQIESRLEDEGIDFVLLFIPSKVSVYPEYVRAGTGEVQVTPIDRLSEYLTAHTSIKVINLKPDLIAAKGEHEVFHRTDTHWNGYGVYAGYESVIKKLSEWGLCDPHIAQVTFAQTEETTDLLNMATGGSVATRTSMLSVFQIEDERAIDDADGELSPEFWQYIRESGIANEEQCSHYVNDSIDGKRALVLGDSFLGSQNVMTLFAENYSEVFFVRDAARLDMGLVNLVQPDVVIFERTERFLNNTPASEPIRE